MLEELDKLKINKLNKNHKLSLKQKVGHKNHMEKFKELFMIKIK